MNDKDLLLEDISGTTDEKISVDAMPKETDSKPNNEMDLTSSADSEENEDTKNEAKPKRKYTKKTSVKNDDTRQAETKVEAAKSKKTGVKKSGSAKKKAEKSVKTSEISETPDDENKPSTISAKGPAADTVSVAEEATNESDKFPFGYPDSISEDKTFSPISFVEEEFEFIPDLTSPIFEDNLQTEYSSPESFEGREDDDADKRILPPDELFADRLEDSEGYDKEIEDSPEETENDLQDAVMEEDGQYRFTEIEDAIEEPIEHLSKEPESEKYDPQKPRRIDGKFDLLELFVFTLLSVMIITSFFFRHSIVEGSSMENTLHGGEHLIISDLFYTPQRGDIIVCEDYTTAIPKPIVKRVIAVGGDTIEIKENGNVYVNGVLLREDYVNIDNPNYRYQDMTVRISEGELFVMGDHRNESTDSREIGTVSEDSVLGKVLIRFYPFDKFGTLE